MSVDAPRLETARLTLPGFTPADVEPYVGIVGFFGAPTDVYTYPISG